MTTKIKTITIGSLTLGNQQPICKIAPIVAADVRKAIQQAADIAKSAADIAEWRLDYLKDTIRDAATLIETGRQIKAALAGLPLIVTNRTSLEGGEFDYPADSYSESYRQLIDANLPDAIDVEFSRADEVIAELRHLTTNAHIPMIMSHHDFKKTPDKNSLIFLMAQMAKQHPEIVKVAVMPQSREDVMNLMDATLAADNQIEEPLITMSMGALGQITRVAGQTFGSIASFGSVSATSAPGQLTIADLKSITDRIK